MHDPPAPSTGLLNGTNFSNPCPFIGQKKVHKEQGNTVAAGLARPYHDRPDPTRIGGK